VATLDVITLAEAKAALNLSGATTYDTELPAWITAVSQLLDAGAGPIVIRTVTGEIHNGDTTSIRTRLYPVKTITTITEYSDTTGTVLTAETNLSKPDAAYLADTYDLDPALLSGVIRRRFAGYGYRFATGQGNVVITYEAGRFNETGSVSERFKLAAKLTLQYLWNSQRPSLGSVGEFEIPQANWPRFAVPNAVQELLGDEWQSSGLLVG